MTEGKLFASSSAGITTATCIRDLYLDSRPQPRYPPCMAIPSAPSSGTLVRALVAGGAVRLLLVDMRGPAEYTRLLHGLGPGAARLAADASVAAVLGSATIKGDEQLTWQFQGSHPRCSVYVDITAQGHLRARTSPPDMPLAAGGRYTGMLLAIKHAPSGEVYRGATGIEGETLEHALTRHLATSDQIDVVLRLGSTTAPDGTVRSAGGLLIERLPEEPSLPSLSLHDFVLRYAWIRGADLQDLLLSAAFGTLGGEPIELLERSEIQWRCRCSQDKIESTLHVIDTTTLDAMIAEDHGATVTCNFCSAQYTVTEQRLVEIRASR